MKKQLAVAALFALTAIPMAAHAIVYQFNATLNTANEIPPPVGSSATGLATLFYDTADNTYDFALSVFNLTGVATGFHIHGAANTMETAGVRVNLANSPFVNFNVGGTLLVGGNGATAPAIGATPSGPTNQGYDPMSFLEMLQRGLAYVNVHTATNGSGEVRGQLMQVAVIPEPGTYALMLGGLAAVGFVARRRKRA